MPNTPDALQALKAVVASHLSPLALRRYHDDTITDAALRLRMDLHLELCAVCRQQLDAVTRLHPSHTELLDYHDQRLTNPRTLARIQAHLDDPPCQECRTWLADMRQAETMAADWLATPAPVPAAVPLRQRLRDVGERLVAGLRLTVGGGLAPQYGTTPPPVEGIAAEGWMVRVRQANDGGQYVTLSSEDEAHAGQMVRLVYTAGADEELQALFQVLCVLPSTPDDAYAYASVVHIPAETRAVWPMDVALQVDAVDPAALQAADVPVLAWSRQQAADTISRDAWVAFCQQEQPLAPEVRAWCAEVCRAEARPTEA